jgi:hypothetical protein
MDGATWSTGSNVYIFGGLGITVLSQLELLDEMWMLNYTSLTWTQLGGDGHGTPPIWNVSSANPGSRRSLQYPSLDHDYRYDCIRFYSTLLIALDKFAKKDNFDRYFTTGDELWLYSGVTYPSQQYSDLWKFELTTRNWMWVQGSSNELQTYPIYGQVGNTYVWANPGPRIASPLWMDRNSKIWIFSGKSSNTSGYARDMWLLDPLASIGLITLYNGEPGLSATYCYGTPFNAAPDWIGSQSKCLELHPLTFKGAAIDYNWGSAFPEYPITQQTNPSNSLSVIYSGCIQHLITNDLLP